MGSEADCGVVFDGKPFEGKVLLETEEVIFHAGKRIVVPLKSISLAEVEGAVLRLRWESHEASLELGEATAKKWAEKIRNPKSRLEKIGVKAGDRVSVLGVDDADLVDELTSSGADVSTRVRKKSDVIFFGANEKGELSKLVKLKESLQPAGALWVIRPKGTKAITESAVMAAGKAAGLVDVKVVKFSETHTAEKFVIPVAQRGK
jgi:hypothetical protein